MTGKPFLQKQSRGSDCVVIVMTAWYGFGNFRKVVNDNQNPGVAVIGGAKLHVIVLDQLIKVSTLNVFPMETNVPRFVSKLLARETLANVLVHCTANSRPTHTHAVGQCSELNCRSLQ